MPILRDKMIILRSLMVQKGYNFIYKVSQIVSVLGREEGYMVKNGLSPRDFPRAQAVQILPYIPT